MTNAPSFRSSSRAFSLFEIVVAMAILGLISGSVFSILWQAGDTAAEVRELDRRDEEVTRFLALLRETIENLPPDGTLEMKPAEETASGYPELVVGNSATAFLFGETIGSSEEAVISLRPGKENAGGEPTFDIAISRSDFAPEDTTGSGMTFRAGADDLLQADEEGRYWLPLLTGVSTAGWNYWDEDQEIWLEEWTDGDRMPVLLAFSFDDSYRPAPLRVVFEVPEHVSNPQAEAAAGDGTSTTSTTSTSTSSSPSNNGRGNPNDGRNGNDRPGRGDDRPDRGGDRPGDGNRPGRPSTGERPGGNPPGGPPGGGNRR